MSNSNLPVPIVEDSAAATKIFFDTYGQPIVDFSADEVASAIAFFEKKGFSREAAISTASALLLQSKVEEVSVFKIIDTLGRLDSLQLSAIVAEILNNNRKTISTLGYRITNITKDEAVRNIAP